MCETRKKQIASVIITSDKTMKGKHVGRNCVCVYSISFAEILFSGILATKCFR